MKMLGLNPSDQEMVDIPNKIARYITVYTYSVIIYIRYCQLFFSQEWFNLLPRILPLGSGVVERGKKCRGRFQEEYV